MKAIVRFGGSATLTLLILAASLGGAAPEDICSVCGNRIVGKIYRFTKLGDESKVFVCADCARIETICYICSLPVKKNFMRLADGRILCDEDAKNAVLEQDNAEKIFDDVKREVQSMLAQFGSLPHHNIHVILEAKARLDKSGNNLISVHDDRLLMGLTRTIVRGEKEFQHNIYLLYGLTRERMIVVTAHEYGHTWLHENVSRRLNQDAVEGFCEWIAYKVIAAKSPQETKVLLDSDYSRGQCQGFIAAEKEHGMYRVIEWVKHGSDPEIDKDHLERMLTLREPSRSVAADGDNNGSALWVNAPVVPRSNPTNLVLKGLSGSAARRFALINDGTFAAQEQGKVRLGESNVVVRCLEIRNDSVVVQVTGEAAPRTLMLGGK